MLLISRQGKVRLTKWYSAYSAKEKARTVREVSAVVLARQQKQCNFLEYKDKKIIYKRCTAKDRHSWRADSPLSPPHKHLEAIRAVPLPLWSFSCPCTTPLICCRVPS